MFLIFFNMWKRFGIIMVCNLIQNMIGISITRVRLTCLFQAGLNCRVPCEVTYPGILVLDFAGWEFLFCSLAAPYFIVEDIFLQKTFFLSCDFPVLMEWVRNWIIRELLKAWNKIFRFVWSRPELNLMIYSWDTCYIPSWWLERLLLPLWLYLKVMVTFNPTFQLCSLKVTVITNL